MKKILVCLFVGLLAISCLIAFILINKQIEIGNVKIGIGEQQLKQGEQSLAEGKSCLSKGEKQLSEGQRMHHDIKNSSLLAVVVAPIAGAAILTSSHLIGKKIKKGEMQIAEGKEKLNQGEQRLSKGQLELKQGLASLKIAKVLRIIFAMGTILFIGLLIYFCKQKKIMNEKSPPKKRPSENA